MRYLIPTILLILAIGLFVAFTNPAYQEVKALRTQSSQLDSALSNATELQQERDALNDKYRALSPDELARLSKLLPDNADNIRLIIDIQQMAESYGMTLSTIKFDANQDSSAAAGAAGALATSSSDVSIAAQDYGAFDFSFTTTTTYASFISLLKDIESSLRLTDVESIDFSAADPVKGTTTFTVKLRTYWLKG